MTQPSRHFAPISYWLISFMFLKYVLQFIPSIGLDVLKNEYHQTARNIGLLAGAYFYTLLFQIPAGVVVDHCKISKVVFLAMGCCLIGAILFCNWQIFQRTLCWTLVYRGRSRLCYRILHARRCLIFQRTSLCTLDRFFGAAAMGGAGMTVLILGWLFENYGWNHLLIISLLLLTGLLCSLGLYFIRQENQYQNP